MFLVGRVDFVNRLIYFIHTSSSSTLLQHNNNIESTTKMKPVVTLLVVLLFSSCIYGQSTCGGNCPSGSCLSCPCMYFFVSFELLLSSNFRWGIFVRHLFILIVILILIMI